MKKLIPIIIVLLVLVVSGCTQTSTGNHQTQDQKLIDRIQIENKYVILCSYTRESSGGNKYDVYFNATVENEIITQIDGHECSADNICNQDGSLVSTASQIKEKLSKMLGEGSTYIPRTAYTGICYTIVKKPGESHVNICLSDNRLTHFDSVETGSCDYIYSN